MVDNAKPGICYIYVWIVRMPFKRAREERLFLLKHDFLGLTPKVDSIGYYDIEDPLPVLISKLRLFSG